MSLDHVHPASLIPMSNHNPEFTSLMRQPVSKQMIVYIALATKRTILIECSSPNPPTSPGSLDKSDEEYPDHDDQHLAAGLPTLENFIYNVVAHSRVDVATLLTTLVYLRRLQARLPAMSSGLSSTRHRVFLATLIVAAKYLNDSSPKNSHWSKYAQLFGIPEINLMEMQLLSLLDYDLRFYEEEACELFYPFMGERTTRVSTPEQQEVRASAVQLVTQATGKARVRIQSSRLIETTTSSSSSALVSAVRSIARRLSSNTLGSNHSIDRIMNTTVDVQKTSPISNSYSSSSPSSGSQASWEMGSLIFDSGSSSDSSLSDGELESGDLLKKKFRLRPVTPRTSRQERKVSDTCSIHTVQADGPIVADSLHQTLGAKRNALQRSSSMRDRTPMEEALALQSSNDVMTDVSLSPVVPRHQRIKDGLTQSSSFLSRIWGAAIKAQDKADPDMVTMVNKKSAWTETEVSIVVPKERYPYRASAFSRLVSSRSGTLQGDAVF